MYNSYTIQDILVRLMHVDSTMYESYRYVLDRIRIVDLGLQKLFSLLFYKNGTRKTSNCIGEWASLFQPFTRTFTTTKMTFVYDDFKSNFSFIKVELPFHQSHLNDENDCHLKLKSLIMHIKQAKK